MLVTRAWKLYINETKRWVSNKAVSLSNIWLPRGPQTPVCSLSKGCKGHTIFRSLYRTGRLTLILCMSMLWLDILTQIQYPRACGIGSFPIHAKCPCDTDLSELQDEKPTHNEETYLSEFVCCSAIFKGNANDFICLMHAVPSPTWRWERTIEIMTMSSWYIRPPLYYGVRNNIYYITFAKKMW